MRQQANFKSMANNKQVVHNQNINFQQMTPRGPPMVGSNNSQSISCTVSTENNSALAAKALESKHPKFMRTIEQTGVTLPTGTHFSQKGKLNNPGTTSTATLMQQDLKSHMISKSKAKSSRPMMANSQSASNFRSTSGQSSGMYQQQFKMRFP